MKYNSRLRYAIRALIALSMEKKDVGLLQSEISQRQNIPYNILDSIIAQLKKNELVKNLKGKSSGYVLVKEIKDITMLEIFKSFSEDFIALPCIKDNCENAAECQSEYFWFEFNSTIVSYLQSVTLNDVVNKKIGVPEA